MLPKGGGALQGMGETFQANPQSGTYQVSVPVDVPEGRHGLTPGLVLTYSSGAGNGPFGLGWSLPIPAVIRSTRKGIPHYGDRDEYLEYLLDGQDLIPAGTWADTGDGRTELVYRMSGDRAYDRVVRVRAKQREWWELTTLSGTTTVFGQTSNSQLRDTAEDPARVFGWFAESTTDTVGNSIVYRYKTDGVNRQVYLSRIDYTDLPGAGGWLYSVVVDYGEYDDAGSEVGPWSDRIDDAFSSFRSGFEIRTARRCCRIFVLLNHPAPVPAEVISRYDLAYQTADGNAVSLLQKITRTGVRRTDGTVEEQPEPPMEFGYSPWTPATGEVTEYGGGNVPRIARDQGVELLDGQGFGCPGVVIYTDTDHRYLDIDAAGTLRLRGEQSGPPNHPVGQDYVWLVDMTGDGYVDLASLKEPWGYYRAIPGSGWEPELTRLGRMVPFVALLDNGRLADVDGDGAADFIGISGGQFHVYHNLGEQGWSPDAETARIPGHCRPDFTEPGTRLADMSGDGPVDLVQVGDTSTAPDTCRITVKYWPHYGHGNFGDRPRELTLPLLVKDGKAEDPFPEGWEQERLLLTDVDGDGYDDVVYVRDADVVVWLNQAGNRLSPPMSIPLTRSGSAASETKLGPGNNQFELASLRMADLGGRGTIGVLWSPVGAAAALRWAPLAPETKPYLLTSVTDHRGAAAAISYRSSASCAYDDAARGRDFQWQTHLPFPVQLVDRVRVTDEFSDKSMTTRYRYHDGVWDGVEREFRGFAHVDQYDTAGGDAAGQSDPVLTRLWFHVGAAGPADASDEPDLRGSWTEDPPLTGSSAESGWLTGLTGRERRRALRAPGR